MVRGLPQVPVVLFSELARLSRWTGPIWSEVVRVISIEQVLPCDKAALGNINRWRDFPNITGRRNFRMSGLRESNRRECQRTRYGKYHCLLHWEAPRGPRANPGGPTVERRFVFHPCTRTRTSLDAVGRSQRSHGSTSQGLALHEKGCQPRRPYFFAPNTLPLDLSIR